MRGAYAKYAEYLNPETGEVRSEQLTRIPQLEVESREVGERLRVVERGTTELDDLKSRVSLLEEPLERIGVNKFLKRGMERFIEGREKEAQQMQDIRDELTKLRLKSIRGE